MPDFNPDSGRYARQLFTDSVVAETRANANPAAIEQRATPRLSIAELNEMDFPEIQNRYAAMRLDTRGSVTKFLDILDLPRNVIANIATSGTDIGYEKRAVGETGTFGLPRIHTSDVLRKLGVKNRVVNGVVGFIGDVAFDPLTYVGPAGWGAKGASAAGRTSKVVKYGAGILKDAPDLIAQGRNAGDPAIMKFLAARGLGPQEVEAMRAAGKSAKEIKQAVALALGGQGQTRFNKLASKIGEDATTSEGLLGWADPVRAVANDADKLAREAAMEFVNRHGTVPGLRIGKDKAGKWGMEVLSAGSGPGRLAADSTIAHIPFTGYGLSVPGFTSAAKYSAALSMLRNAGNASVEDPGLMNALRRFDLSAQKLDELKTSYQALDELDKADIAAGLQPIAGATTDPELRKSLNLEIGQNVDFLKALDAQLQADVGGQLKQAATLDDPAKILAYAQLREAHDAQLSKLRADLRPFLAQQGSGEAAYKQFADLVDLDTASETARRVGQAKGRQADGLGGYAAEWQESGLKQHRLAEELRATGDGLTEPFKGLETSLDSDAAEAFRLRKELHGQADSFAAQARRNLEAADDIASGRASEEFAAMEGANPNDPTSMLNLNALRERYGDMPRELYLPLDEKAIRDQAAQDVARLQRLKLDYGKDWIADISPDQMSARAAMADLLQNQFRAGKELSDAIKAPLQQTIDSKALQMARAAEIALGVEPGMIGNGGFMDMASALSGIMGETRIGEWLKDAAVNVDRATRSVFGNKSGVYHELERAILRENHGAGPTFAMELGSRMSDLKKVAAGHKIPANELDSLAQAVYIAAVNLQHSKAPVFAADSPIWAKINELKESGWFNEKLYPGLRGEIEELAAREIDTLDRLAQAEQRSGLLGVGREAYLPNIATGEARMKMARVKRDIGGGKSFGPELQEAFEKPRSTIRFQVVDKNGNALGNYLQGEREAIEKYGKNDIAALDPVSQDYIRAKKELFAVHDQIPDQPAPEVLDAIHINSLVQQGAFAPITGGGDLARGFFETNMPMAMASRLGAHERSRLRLMMDAVAESIGMPVQQDQLARVMNDVGQTHFTTRSGVTGKLIHATQEHKAAVQLGNQRWRMLDAATIGASHDILDLSRSQLARVMLPEQVAEKIENVYRTIGKEGEVQNLLKTLDSMTGIWKSLTLLHPSWTVGNLVGGVVQMLSVGITPAEIARHAFNAAKIAFRSHDKQALEKIAVELGGGSESGAQVWKNLHDGRAVNAGPTNEVFVHTMLKDGQMMLPNQWSLFRNPIKAAKEMSEHAQMRVRAGAYGNISASVPGFDKLSHLKHLVIDEAYMNRAIKPFFSMNGKAEDWMRTIAYLALRDKGYDASSATSKVVEALFDFADMTNVEQGALRRLLPFYAWTRNSAAYGIKMLLEQPKYFTIAPLAKHSLEEMFAGEQRVPEYARPRWMREQLAMQLGSDPESRSALMLGSYLPQEAAMRLTSAVGSPLLGQAALADGVGYFSMGINPALRIPLEIGQGREFYTGRTISGNENEGDQSVLEYAASQVRPLRELGIGQTRKGPLPAAFERSVGEGVARTFVGGRSQPFGAERIKAAKEREYKTTTDGIRRRINLAERDKNKNASIAARVQLLKVFDQMRREGFKIPAWAQEQVGQLNQ